MAFETLIQRWRRPGVVPVIAFLILLLGSLHLMSDAVQQSTEYGRFFVPLLALTVTGLLILAVLITVNLGRLVIRYRQQAAGSRLTGRMLLMFSVLSLVPVSVVYYYSLGFLLKGIDTWFDVKIDRAMENALELSQAALGVNQRVLLKYSEHLLAGIADQSEAALAISLDELRRQSGATELTLMKESGQVLASSNADPTVLVAEVPENEILQQLKAGINYVGLVPRGGDDLQIRVMVRDLLGRRTFLHGLFPTSERVSLLSTELEDAYNHYKELAYLRQSLKFSFTLTLSLVLIFSLLTALWTAFHWSRRLAKPVASLAEGTRAVAEGDYDRQLPLPKYDDELGFLVASFNAMTRRISQARNQAARSQREVESQRAYLETVLSRLSTGVMAFDAENRLQTANPASKVILRAELEPYLGRRVEELAGESEHLRQFVDAITDALNDLERDWREEVMLSGHDGRQVLMCRSTPIAEGEESQRGHVVVFDDITNLIQAQRNAAWGEVARRLAHEIKNPLTPIQLSAERLRHKYLKTMADADAQILDRSTHTIIQQVEAMKEMVNAFSEYARPPHMQPQPIVADKLFSEVLDLYQSEEAAIKFDVVLAAGDAHIEADPARLRQVVHNLIKNAQEAVADQADGRVSLRTKVKVVHERRFVEMRVADNGPGFDRELLGTLFEPYVTTKVKGTGLGLAIVKKIVEEHGGIIWAENKGQGALVVLQLPILDVSNISYQTELSLNEAIDQ